MDERLIEQYVHRPEQMSPEDRETVEEALSSDVAAAEVADFYRAFYAQWKTAGALFSPSLEKLVDQVFPPAFVTPLHSFRPSGEGYEADQPYTRVLAAMTPETLRHRFETVATLTTPDQDVLLRIFHDRETETFQLHAISDNPDKRANVIISFTDLGMEFVTDKTGRITFSLDSKPDWAASRALLRRPVADCKVLKQALSSDRAYTHHFLEYEATCEWDGECLHITVKPDAENVTLISRVVADLGEQHYLFILREGNASLDLKAMPESFVVRFYQ